MESKSLSKSESHLQTRNAEMVQEIGKSKTTLIEKNSEISALKNEKKELNKQLGELGDKVCYVICYLTYIFKGLANFFFFFF